MIMIKLTQWKGVKFCLKTINTMKISTLLKIVVMIKIAMIKTWYLIEGVLTLKLWKLDPVSVYLS